MITVGLPSGRVEGIYLFQRTGPTVLEAGKNEVVLGVGAYGVAIGDSEDSLDAKRRVGETGGYMGYEYRLSDGRRLLVEVENAGVERLIVTGNFRTHEGITQNSTQADVVRVYGKPDQTMRFRSKATGTVTPPWVGWLTALIVGAVCGLVTRRMINPRTSAPNRLIYGLDVGAAVSMIVTSLHYLLVTRSLIVLSYVVKTLPLHSVPGALGTGVFALLRPRTTPVARAIPAFLATWAAWFVSGYAIFVLQTGNVAIPIHYVGRPVMATALTTLGLCLLGRQAPGPPPAEILPPPSDA
jgi:uncharacterized membrane protein YeaQ/YmgE (transglycosylase-associated protein family)